MSIATDEANSVADEQMMSHFYYSDSPLSFPEAKNFGKDMYVAGRTAEPTEAEIEAAARVFFGNLHHPSASLDWDKAADYVKDNWRLKTRLALDAARKEVSE